MTTVLVVNSGSSSLKYQLVDPADGTALASGIVERIGEAVADHTAAVALMLDDIGAMIEQHPPVAVGHRVVHGGDRFVAPTLITDDVEADIQALAVLAPLHNPGALQGIRAARAAFPDLPHVAVFDTAFHQTLPPTAYTYAIDRDVARQHGIRRYGFHGTSHQYVSEQAAAFLGRDVSDLKQIVFHLGNGASVAAIAGGRSVETSMGLTPLEGLVMGTRSGDVDPAALLHLARTAGLTIDDLDELLNRRSGMLGLSGMQDMRDIQKAQDAGDTDALLAFGVYVHRLRAYAGAYIAQLGGVDVISFTAGVGENAPRVRAEAISALGFMGVRIDDTRNEGPSRETRVISTDDSSVTVLVVPTNEELAIARQARGFAA